MLDAGITVLIFQSTSDIADFVIRKKVKNALVDSREYTLTAKLGATDIEYAKKEYNAQFFRRLQEVE